MQLGERLAQQVWWSARIIAAAFSPIASVSERSVHETAERKVIAYRRDFEAAEGGRQDRRGQQRFARQRWNQDKMKNTSKLTWVET